MSERWAFADKIWDKSYAPLLGAGYSLERVDATAYWELHEKHLRPHFPPEAFIDTAALRTELEKNGQAKIRQTRGDHELRNYCIVRERDHIAGSFCGHLKTDNTYRMRHTSLHRDYRRRGIYRMVLAGTIAYTAELGFDEIVSEHAPGNNAVLIAKLKAGFRITGIDVHPTVGLSVHLTYFHNQEHLDAYLFRCGLATVTPRMLEHGMGAMSRMVEQFRAQDGDAE